MRITGIERQKHRERFNVAVDDKFWGGLSASVLAIFNLYEGKEVTKDYLESVFLSELESRLYERCLRVVGMRPRSEKELRRYISDTLRKKKSLWVKGTWYENDSVFFEKAREAVWQRLEKEKLVDEDAFARWWVEQRMRSGFKGWQLIRSELLSKGIDSEVADRLKFSHEEEYTLARKTFDKFCKRAGVTKEKCIRRLLSRGFSWDIVKKIVKYDDDDGISMD